MNRESQLQYPEALPDKNDTSENKFEPKRLSIEEAIEQYNEKRHLIEKLMSVIKEITSEDEFMTRYYNIYTQIHDVCFQGLEIKERNTHLMHHVLSGSTISQDSSRDMDYYVYDLRDKKVEDYLNKFCTVEGTVAQKNEKVTALERELGIEA